MEEYGNLEKIINETIQRTLSTKNLNLILFVQQMEKEFTRLGFRQPEKGALKNILVVRVDAVGDFILTSAALRELRLNYPGAYITLVVSKIVYPMAELCPYVNEVLPFDKNFDKNNFIETMRHVLEFSKNYLWKRHYDISFDFVADWLHMSLSYLSGAAERFGYFFEPGNQLSMRKILFNHSTFLDHDKFIHSCERNLYLLQHFGLNIRSTGIEVWFSGKDVYQAKNIIKDFAPSRLKIAVGIGATVPERKYPVEKYLVAFKKIIKKGAAIIILGGPSEVDDAKFLEDNLQKKFVKNVVKVQPSWRITAAIISQTDIYLGNDTGTQHVAAALKKPVIVLSRDSKDHERTIGKYCEHIGFYPYQTKSVVIMPEHSLGDCAKDLTSNCRAGKSHCIAQIEPAEIVDAYEKMLKFVK